MNPSNLILTCICSRLSDIFLWVQANFLQIE